MAFIGTKKDQERRRQAMLEESSKMKLGSEKEAQATQIRLDYEKLGIQQPKKSERSSNRSLEEERQDAVFQRQQADQNLKSLPGIRPENVSAILDRFTNDEIYLLNSNFEDIQKELKGKKNIDTTFFRAFFDRYLEKQAATGNTGIEIALSEDALQRRLDALQRRITGSLYDEMVRLRPYFDRLLTSNRGLANEIIEKIYEAHGRSDTELHRIIDILLQMAERNDFDMTALRREVSSISNRMGGRPMEKYDLNDLEKLRDQHAGGKKELTQIAVELKITDINGRPLDRCTKQQIFEAIAEFLEETDGFVPQAYPEAYDFNDLKVPDDVYYDLSDEEENVFRMFHKRSKEDLLRYITEYQKPIADEIYGHGGPPLRSLDKSQIMTFLFALVKLGKITPDLFDAFTPERYHTYTGFKTGLEPTDPRLVKYLEKTNVSAQKIQEIYKEFARRKKSAKKIQATFRGFQTRQGARRENLAKTTQRLYRGFQGRKLAREQRDQQQEEKNAQEREDAIEELERLRDAVRAFPDGPWLPGPAGARTKPQLSAILDQYEHTRFLYPPPRYGEDPAVFQARTVALGEAQALRQRAIDAINQITANLRGRVPENIDEMIREANAMKPRLAELRQETGDAKAQIQHLLHTKPAGYHRLVPDLQRRARYSDTEFVALNTKFEELNRAIQKAGRPDVGGFGLSARKHAPKRSVRGYGVNHDLIVEKNAPFGKYYLHIPSLQNSIINLRYKQGTPKMSKFTCSSDLANFIFDVLQNGAVSDFLYEKLSDTDKVVFRKLCALSECSKTLGLAPSAHTNKDQDDLMHEFELTRGEILAGNNSPDVLHKCRRLILQLVHSGRMANKEAHELLFQISSLLG